MPTSPTGPNTAWIRGDSFVVTEPDDDATYESLCGTHRSLELAWLPELPNIAETKALSSRADRWGVIVLGETESGRSTLQSATGKAIVRAGGRVYVVEHDERASMGELRRITSNGIDRFRFHTPQERPHAEWADPAPPGRGRAPDELASPDEWLEREFGLTPSDQFWIGARTLFGNPLLAWRLVDAFLSDGDDALLDADEWPDPDAVALFRTLRAAGSRPAVAEQDGDDDAEPLPSVEPPALGRVTRRRFTLRLDGLPEKIVVSRWWPEVAPPAHPERLAEPPRARVGSRLSELASRAFRRSSYGPREWPIDPWILFTLVAVALTAWWAFTVK